MITAEAMPMKHPLKRPCKPLAATLAAALLLAALAAIAAVPTEWQIRVGPKATVFQVERYHGDALALRATLTSGGLPLEYQGAARLYAQTNGMGTVWWNLADVTVSGNVLAATWLPEFDTGADVVDVFLGAPSNYQAHARIRFLPSPGPVPNALPLPRPVLDFEAVEIQNLAALTNGWTFGGAPGDYDALSNRPQINGVTLGGTNNTAVGLGLLGTGGGTITGPLQIGATGKFPITFDFDAGDTPYMTIRDGIGNFLVLEGNKLYYQQYDVEYGAELFFPTNSGTLALVSDIPAPSVPSAPEVTTALRWRADGTACVVTVAAGGTLTADTSNWTEGQAVMAIITLAEGAGIAQGIELVGYGTWPVGTPFVACCYRVGVTVYVVPSVTL